jgi:plastocyanin
MTVPTETRAAGICAIKTWIRAPADTVPRPQRLHGGFLRLGHRQLRQYADRRLHGADHDDHDGATTYTIEVAPNNILAYVPSTLVIHTGDTVVLSYDQISNSHTVTTGTNCIQDQDLLFNFSSTGQYTVTAPGVYGVFCTVSNHCALGERGTITVE